MRNDSSTELGRSSQPQKEAEESRFNLSCDIVKGSASSVTCVRELKMAAIEVYLEQLGLP